MEPFNIANFLEAVKEQQLQMEKDSEPEKNIFDTLGNLGKLEWLTKTPPPRQYIFSVNEYDGFLPAGKTSMIISPGGCGKTFLLTHCALAAATGTNWLHTKANNPIKVLFVAAEEDDHELWIRFHNMAKGLKFENKPDLFELVKNNVIPFASRGISQKFIDERGSAQKYYNQLKEYLTKNDDIKLVILDPASRFMGPETETNNAAATDFINLIDALTMVGGKPTVLIAHHTNKSAIGTVKDGRVPNFSQAFSRGSSALIDGCRWMMGIQRSEAKESHRSIFVKMLKSNYSGLGQILEFEQDFGNSGLLRYVGEVSLKERELISAKNGTSPTADQNHNNPFGYNLGERHD